MYARQICGRTTRLRYEVTFVNLWTVARRALRGNGSCHRVLCCWNRLVAEESEEKDMDHVEVVIA